MSSSFDLMYISLELRDAYPVVYGISNCLSFASKLSGETALRDWVLSTLTIESWCDLDAADGVKVPLLLRLPFPMVLSSSSKYSAISPSKLLTFVKFFC